MGSSAPRVVRVQLSGPARRISKSGPQNSAMTWRHTPQGAQAAAGGPPSGPPAMAMARNFRWPSATARKKAVRSAQLVAVRPAFSMLQPAYTEPSSQSRAAPTAKWE